MGADHLTDQLSLSIPAPLCRATRPPEPIIRAADLDDDYRWLAYRAWGSGPCILWCGVNPSLADGRRDDPTMWRMMGFAYRWGFGSMIVVNLYPFVTPNQVELRKWCRAWRQQKPDGVWPYQRNALNAWGHNIGVVKDAIGKSDVHVAAWGNGADREDLEDFFDELELADVPPELVVPRSLRARSAVAWRCLGRTSSGAPTHPLARGKHRVPDDAVLIDWKP